MGLGCVKLKGEKKQQCTWVFKVFRYEFSFLFKRIVKLWQPQSVTLCMFLHQNYLEIIRHLKIQCVEYMATKFTKNRVSFVHSGLLQQHGGAKWHSLGRGCAHFKKTQWLLFLIDLTKTYLWILYSISAIYILPTGPLSCSVSVCYVEIFFWYKIITIIHY